MIRDHFDLFMFKKIINLHSRITVSVGFVAYGPMSKVSKLSKIKIVKIFKIGKSVKIVKRSNTNSWKLQILHLAHLLYTNFGIFHLIFISTGILTHQGHISLFWTAKKSHLSTGASTPKAVGGGVTSFFTFTPSFSFLEYSTTFAFGRGHVF